MGTPGSPGLHRVIQSSASVTTEHEGTDLKTKLHGAESPGSDIRNHQNVCKAFIGLLITVRPVGGALKHWWQIQGSLECCHSDLVVKELFRRL